MRSPQPAPRSASVRRGDTKALRKHVRIENIAARYTRLRGSGRELRGDCPLCDSDESSFSVSRDKQLFYCFDCHAGGHVIQLAMAMEHFSPTEAFDWLVRQAGLTETDSAGQPTSRDRLLEAHRLAVDFYRTQLESPQAAVARTFLAERGFDQAAAAHFGVGYSPASWDNLTRFLRDKGFTHKELTLSGLSQEGRRGPIDRFRGRLVWPIRDMIGDTVGFAARRLHDQDNGPKYITTPKTPIYDKSQVLFGIDLARKSIATSSRAVVVEGYTDVMACHMAGVNTAIAPCGTIFSSDHVHLLHRLLGEDGRGRTTFTFDGDEAGQRAALRFIESDQLFAAASYITIVPDGLNPCELRIAKGNEAVTDLAEPRIPLLEFVFQQIATRHNLQTPVGRVAALDEAAPLVARIKSSAFQHEIAVQLADMLKIRDTQFVARHVAQLAREARASASDSSAPLSRKPVYATERELLKLALQYPHLVSPTFDAYGADEFTAPPYAAVRQAILDAGGVEQGCKDPHAYLVSVREAAPDDAVRALVTELAIETVYRKTVDDAYAGDQLAHVRQRSVDRRIHYLQRALAVLGAGDDPVQQKGVESELWKLQQYAMDLRVRGVQAL
ncbi:DNA primase [Streptomyces tauricus]|uniref:DNA primase n=1 Tax=Streptomyces tauricus TaxID=68274 RepID=UPI003570B236